MRLTSIHIENFRGLKDILFDLPTAVTTIVGPNGIGKSSVLEAIRLTKAILAPSFNGEGQQVLTSLGALIPSLNTLRLDTLVGDVASPLRVVLRIDLTPAEVQSVRERVPQLARLRVRNLLGSANTDELALVQYLSTSEGQERYNLAVREVTDSLQQLDASRSIALSLTIDPSTGEVRGGDVFHQEVATILMENQPPSLGTFTYFPADRAMPRGEVNIQIGSADAAAQLHSHLGQPAAKYQRLKQHMVNQTLTTQPQKCVKISR